MGELFWNKVAGAVLGTGLVLFAANEVGHVAVHSTTPDTLVYPVDLGDTVQTAAVEEETGPVDFGLLLQTASIDAGASSFRAKCSACHSPDEGGPNGIGPALWGVYGRVAGEHDGFNYSSAMQDYAQPWVTENLYAYLERPVRYVQGTAMNFIGLRRQDERINVIAYLNSLDATPEPLPEPLGESASLPTDGEAVQEG